MRRCIRARSVWKTLNYPMYVPEEDPEIAALLTEGNVGELAALLKRRASLGSGSAAAMLGFLEFMGAISGKENPQAAISYCNGPAKAGDPYAQYVLAWAYWGLGDRTEALRWMRRPAKGGFLPALVDAARMLVVLANSAEELRTAVGLLWGAHKLGHTVPLAVIAGISLRGRLGPIRCLFGLVMAPYALIRMLLVLSCEPFGIKSFCIRRRPNVPFFRRVVHASRPDRVSG